MLVFEILWIHLIIINSSFKPQQMLSVCSVSELRAQSVVVLLSEIYTVLYSRPISPLNCLKHCNYFSILRYRSDTICPPFVWLSGEFIFVLLCCFVCVLQSQLIDYESGVPLLIKVARISHFLLHAYVCMLASIYNYYNESYNICVLCKVLIMYYETNAILCKTLSIIYTRMYVCMHDFAFLYIKIYCLFMPYLFMLSCTQRNNHGVANHRPFACLYILKASRNRTFSEYMSHLYCIV